MTMLDINKFLFSSGTVTESRALHLTMLEDYNQSGCEFNSRFGQVLKKAAALNLEVSSQNLDAGDLNQANSLQTASFRSHTNRNERNLGIKTSAINHLAGESVIEGLECDSGVWVSDSTLFRDTTFEVSAIKFCKHEYLCATDGTFFVSQSRGDVECSVFFLFFQYKTIEGVLYFT